MNTEPDATSPPDTDGVSVSSLVTSDLTVSSLTSSLTSGPLPASPSSDALDPEFTIMVVLGLSLLLAGVAAFLAVCRPSDPDGASEAGCGPGEGRGGRTRGARRSSEPQLKVWKRLGSYRRSFNTSFRRPAPRRPYEAPPPAPLPGLEPPPTTPGLEPPPTTPGLEPPPTTPGLLHYVTEI